jgi:hypothetical protein
MKKHVLGILALLVGAAALTLGILAEEERHWLQDEYERHQKERTTSPGLTIEVGKLSFKLGGKAEPKEPAPLPSKYSPFWVAALVAGILGLILAPLAWVREKQPILSGAAASLCAVGLLWHYVVIGVCLAIAIVVLAAIVAAFD